MTHTLDPRHQLAHQFRVPQSIVDQITAYWCGAALPSHVLGALRALGVPQDVIDRVLEGIARPLVGAVDVQGEVS
jgi:hypothetical protein